MAITITRESETRYIIEVAVEDYLKSERLITDIVDKLKETLVKDIYEKNADRIMSKLDFDGIAKLISIYAAKELTKK